MNFDDQKRIALRFALTPTLSHPGEGTWKHRSEEKIHQSIYGVLSAPFSPLPIMPLPYLGL
jgi:hypothetical protein